MYIHDPYKWKTHPKIIITRINKIGTLLKSTSYTDKKNTFLTNYKTRQNKKGKPKENKKLSNNIKQLVCKISNENFRFSSYDDPIWIAQKKNSLRLLGICMLSKSSPGNHFDNEPDINFNKNKDKKDKDYLFKELNPSFKSPFQESKRSVPYMYNMIVNILDNDTKRWKVAPSLLMQIRKDFSDPYIKNWLGIDPSFLNLNIHENNQHAYNFYIKNNFKDIGECPNKNLKGYKMLTLKL